MTGRNSGMHDMEGRVNSNELRVKKLEAVVTKLTKELDSVRRTLELKIKRVERQIQD